MKNVEIAIIGAGLSGLILGRELQKKNKSIILIEKSNGLGGRIATRRIEDKGFDHGAPYLSYDGNLRDILTELNVSAALSPEGLHVDGGMTRIAKLLGKDLPVLLGHKVERIDDEMKITTDLGEVILAKKIVLTAPLPQALDLLRKNKISFSSELESITYTKALMALAVSKSPEIKTSQDIHSILEMKQRNLHPDGFVIRATPEFSDINFEKSDEEMLQWFKDVFSNSSHMEVKRWRYATPLNALPYDYFEVKDNLFLIGDAFKHPDVRGSISSALKLAQKLA